MDTFVKYDEQSFSFISRTNEMIPSVCKKCVKEHDEKCINHYKELKSNCLTICPKGFYSIRMKDDIITCLTPIGCRGLKNMKKDGDNTSELVILSKDNINSIINSYYDLKDENDWLHASIHDLKNIVMYFNSMEFNVRQEFPDLSQTNDNFISMLELYNLMKYRLSLIGTLPEQGYEKQFIPIHSLLLKLIRILNYKAKNKKVSFSIDSTELKVYGNDYLYLAFFTLIDNAVKYAPPKSSITFYFEEKGKYLTVHVENIGPRLDEDEIDSITIRKYRGKYNTNTTGNGVGLAVYKEICDRCNYKYKFKTKYLNPNQSLFTALITLEIIKDSIE